MDVNILYSNISKAFFLDHLNIYEDFGGPLIDFLSVV
jgi:hypothetical protein